MRRRRLPGASGQFWSFGGNQNVTAKDNKVVIDSPDHSGAGIRRGLCGSPLMLCQLTARSQQQQAFLKPETAPFTNNGASSDLTARSTATRGQGNGGRHRSRQRRDLFVIGAQPRFQLFLQPFGLSRYWYPKAAYHHGGFPPMEGLGRWTRRF